MKILYEFCVKHTLHKKGECGIIKGQTKGEDYETRNRCSQADFHKSLNLHENPIKPDGIRVFQNAAKI